MKRKYALDANRLFLLSIVLSQLLVPAVILLGVQDIMLLQFLVEFFMFLPCLIYLFMQKRPLKESIGINPLTWKQWLLLIPLAVCVDKIAEFVNVVSQLFTTNSVGSYMVELILRYPMPLAFFVIAVTPMICEEFIYRGVIYQGYRRSNILVAVVLSAFLFGIMHMNLNQFSYAVVLGVLFCLINEAAGSILPSLMMHLYINGRSVVLLYMVVNYLTGLHNEYVAAEAVGNKELMAGLIEQAQGIPIHEEDWLSAYMSMGAEEVPESILSTVPWLVVSVIVIVLIIRYFLKITGRTEHFRRIFTRKTKEYQSETEREKISVLSPSLVIGCLICIAMMIYEML